MKYDDNNISTPPLWVGCLVLIILFDIAGGYLLFHPEVLIPLITPHYIVP